MKLQTIIHLTNIPTQPIIINSFKASEKWKMIVILLEANLAPNHPLDRVARLWKIFTIKSPLKVQSITLSVKVGNCTNKYINRILSAHTLALASLKWKVPLMRTAVNNRWALEDNPTEVTCPNRHSPLISTWIKTKSHHNTAMTCRTTRCPHFITKHEAVQINFRNLQFILKLLLWWARKYACEWR